MKLASFALTLCAVLTVGSLEAMSFVASALFGLAVLLLLIASLGHLVAGFIKRRRTLVIRGVIFVAAIPASLFLGRIAQNAQVRESKRRGDQICAALESFRDRVGEYPASLDALAPVDISEVPVTAMGVVRTIEFSYHVVAPNDFDLRFSQPAWTGWRRGRDAGWIFYD